MTGRAGFPDADYTFVNDRLARHYRLVEFRSEFRKGNLPEHRVAVITQASVLARHRTRPHIAGQAGAMAVRNILGTPPPAPPPGVEQLNDARCGRNSTLRQLG